MKVFFVYSGSYEFLLREAQVKILCNYATINRQKGLPKGFPEIIIDSGGYQLQVGTTGKFYTPNRLTLDNKRQWKWVRKPEVDAYAFWLQSEILPNYPEVVGYFNLDVLGDGLTTLENQITMEKYGLKPIPIWHLGEGEEYLSFYYNNYDYIAVGGIVSKKVSKSELTNLVSLLTQKYPGRKYHYFGVGITGTSVFREARPYSVDFSTWVNPARFGTHIIADPKQILREEGLSPDIRKELKVNKELEYDYLREAIKRIKELEYTIDSIHSNEHQVLLL